MKLKCMVCGNTDKFFTVCDVCYYIDRYGNDTGKSVDGNGDYYCAKCLSSYRVIDEEDE